MHAYIITGSNADGRMKYLETLLSSLTVSSHDILTIVPVDDTIAVEHIRSSLFALSRSRTPQENRGICIYKAHTMTRQAQNALPKTLEEPVNSRISLFLETDHPYALLPTIRSRCILTPVTGNDEAYSIDSTTTALLRFIEEKNTTLSHAIQYTDRMIDSRQSLETVVMSLLQALRSQCHREVNEGTYSFTTAICLRNTLIAWQMSRANVQYKLIADLLLTHSLHALI